MNVVFGTLNYVTVILFVYALWLIIPNKRFSFETRFWSGLGIGFCIFMVCLAIADLGITAAYPENRTFYIKIKSLSSKNELHGEFTLGCGTIDQIDYYYTFREYDGGWLKMKLRSDSITIVEDDSKLPHIIYIDKGVKDNKITRFFIVNMRSCVHADKLVVPSNTIISKYAAN